MKISRSLISTDVLVNKLLGLQVKFLDTVLDTDKISTEFLIGNNQKTYDDTDTIESTKEEIEKNVMQLEQNQKNRLINIPFYEKQIKFLQDVIALSEDEFIEIDETLKEFIK